MASLIEKLRPTVGHHTASGEEPDWVVVDLHGSYPTHRPGGAALAMLQRAESFESLTAHLDRIGKADWVTGVLVRVSTLTTGLATARAIGQALRRLAERKRVVAYVPQVSTRTLLVTAGVPEVVAPESAEVLVPGFAAEQVYLGALLSRHGIAFENLRIGEYKSALTTLTNEEMDPYEREQLTAYVESVERTWVAELAQARGIDPEGGTGWFDPAISSAAGLLEAGLITRIAYEDELLTTVGPHWGRALQFLEPQLSARRRTRRTDGVAVVPVIGAIVAGRGRGAPIPFLHGPQAGSDTVVAALHKAERDEHTKAIVLYVDSGGGSALASDLIDRAVARCTKPVVAVMGELAASGGYYVLAHATRVIANPYTITGSIGVVIGKPVLERFNERHGLNPEVVGREQALLLSPSRPFSDDQREWAERVLREVYDRFVDRVATGRNLTRERVDELGRGRIWSGADAVANGLADELGDLSDGVAAARRLAGLTDDAPVRTLSAGMTLPGVPTFGKQPAATLASLWPFGDERALTWFDRSVTVR